MPIYSFICPECDYICEVSRSMRFCDEPLPCVCGVYMVRDFAADQINAGGKDYVKPIHSDSLAISPRQRAEHERMFPNIKLDNHCRPIFDSFRAHQDYLDKCNIVKHPQKIKKKGVKI